MGSMKQSIQGRGVRIAAAEELPLAVDVLTEAFAQDPLIGWLLENARAGNRREILMRYLVREAFDTGFVLITDDQLGTAAWITEKKAPMTWEALSRDVQFLRALGLRTALRCLADHAEIARHHPKDSPFVYLSLVGVLPQGRGRGLASGLMDPVLAHCRAEGIPVHLETATPANVEIYKRKGFAVTDTVQKGPTIQRYMKTGESP